MATFDPFRNAYLENPYPSLRRLRDEDPVHRSRDLDRFDITREIDTGDILSFGIGPHFCLGQPLALIQGEEMLQAMAERFPDLRLARDGLVRARELLLRGPTRLELSWR